MCQSTANRIPIDNQSDANLTSNQACPEMNQSGADRMWIGQLVKVISEFISGMANRSHALYKACDRLACPEMNQSSADPMWIGLGDFGIHLRWG